MELTIKELKQEHIEECVDIYVNTFSKEPWYDKIEEIEPVYNYFKNFIECDSYLGYVGIINEKIVSFSVGMKKPWIEGIEYYIDEFCVDYPYQNKGIGSMFINEIEKEIKNIGLDGMLLNTEEGYPSYSFYLKNGFKKIGNVVVLAK